MNYIYIYIYINIYIKEVVVLNVCLFGFSVLSTERSKGVCLCCVFSSVSWFLSLKTKSHQQHWPVFLSIFFFLFSFISLCSNSFLLPPTPISFSLLSPLLFPLTTTTTTTSLRCPFVKISFSKKKKNKQTKIINKNKPKSTRY